MRLRYLLALAVLAAWPVAAYAEHASIDLRVFRINADAREENFEARASVDVEPPAGGFSKRPLLKVKAGEPLMLRFFLTNTYPHGLRKDVTVRYFVVREEKAGQKEVPSLKKGVVTQGRFKMDFKPKCKVGAQVEFSIKKAGFYLLRVQTNNTQSDHEHFSAIDLQVE